MKTLLAAVAVGLVGVTSAWATDQVVLSPPPATVRGPVMVIEEAIPAPPAAIVAPAEVAVPAQVEVQTAQPVLAPDFSYSVATPFGTFSGTTTVAVPTMGFAPVVAARPVVGFFPAPAPVTVFRAPVAVAPVWPAPVVVGRPVVVTPPRVYVPGQPVRNFWRAVLP